MKKLSLQLISAFDTLTIGRVKAVKIFFLAFILCCVTGGSFAQVTVTPATGGIGICPDTAASACVTLAPVTITETHAIDFTPGVDQFTLNAPAGWQFCTTTTPTITYDAGGDISALPPPSITLIGGSWNVSFNVSGSVNVDFIKISGLAVLPTSTGALPGFIYAAPVTGIPSITSGAPPSGGTGTDFGDLALITPITSSSSTVCVGFTDTLKTTTHLGTWSSSSAIIASINVLNDSTVVVTGHSAGAAIITHFVGGCSVTFDITVDPNPDPIMGLTALCAYSSTEIVKDVPSGGTWTSSLVTIANLGATGDTSLGLVTSFAEGSGTITYTLPSGCYITANVTINPLPSKISGDSLVCAGSTIVLTDSVGPGTWSSLNTVVATVGTTTGPYYPGLVTGITAGIDTIVYTLPTGCSQYYVITVNPLPAPITSVSGLFSMCDLGTLTLSDGSPGGTWSISSPPPAVGIISTGGVVTGISPGTASVLYTLPTGCATITTITVNPNPPTIGGPNNVCVGSSITLTDALGPGIWTSGNDTVATIDSIAGILNGLDSGTVTIFYTLGTGCKTQAIITVNPLPAAIHGPTEVCVGSTIQDSVATPGGIWSASNPTAIVTTGGYIFGVPPGPSIDTIYYTLPTGCVSSTIVTIDAVPEAITGLDSICVGDTAALSDGSIGGIWVSGDPSRATVDSITGKVTGISADTLPVNIYYTVGICSSPAFPVTIDPVPPVYSGDSTVCQGSTITLTDSLPSGTWSSSITSLATIGSLSGIVAGVSAGTVTITFTGRGGCFSHRGLTVYGLLPIDGPNNVCVGETIALIDSFPGGMWSTSNGNSVITDIGAGTSIASASDSGVSAGVDTIYYTTANGCPTSFIITVNPLTSIIGLGSGNICVGSSVMLSDSTPGGVWVSSDTSIATVDSAGLVTGVGHATATITYLLPTGCQAVLLITVNPLPVPIFGDTTVCQGMTDTLSDTTSFAAGTWSTTNSSIATINPSTGVLTGLSGGADTVVFTLAGTGCNVEYVVTVNPLAGIAGITSLCDLTSTTFSDSLSGGTWTTTPTAIGTIDTSGMFTGLEPGVDSIVYTMPTGCSAVYLVTVDEVPSPIMGDPYLYTCLGVPFLLADTGKNGTWTSANTGVATISTYDSLHGNVFTVSPGTDTITYTLNPGNCSVSVVITINPVPASPGGITHVCVGDTTTITDPTSGGYWTNLDTGIAAIDTTGLGGDSIVKIIGKTAGVVSVLYSLPVDSMCNVTAIVTVNPIPAIIVNDTLPELKCPWASVGLHASGATDTASGVLGTYLWEPNYALSSATSPDVIATPTVTTTYTVVGTSPWGCPDSTTVTVFVDDSMTHLRVVASDSICKGQCDVLNASGRAGSAFNWHPPVGLSCTICDTPTACPDTTTMYWAVAIDDIGCKDSISFTVTVNPIPIIVVNPPNVRLCRGVPIQLFASSTNTDSLTDTYAWYPDILISNDSVPNPIISDTTNLVYRVIGTTIYGCYDSFNVKVSVLDTNMNTVNNDTNICIYDSTYLRAYSHSLISNLDVPTYTWAPTEYVNYPDSSFTYVHPFVTTTYTVTIVENMCFTKQLTVTVSVQPFPEIGMGQTFESVIAGTPVQLDAFVNNTPVLSYLWTPPGTSCDTCYNPVVTPTGNTTYTVTVTSAYGCVSTDTITIHMLCDNSEVFIPNTFTPNGDGVNDRFYVSGKGISIINKLAVYNRWGQLVFEAQNIPPNQSGYGWDGTFKGLVLEPDVFVYFVEAQCELGTVYKYQGNVSLVR